MEAILQILVVLFLVAGVISLFFLLGIQPIWGIVDVAISREHSGGTKAAVILLTLLLLGPIMTFFYACFGSPSRVFRRMTVTALVITLISAVVVIGLAIAAPAVRKKFNLPVAASQDGTNNSSVVTVEVSGDWVTGLRLECERRLVRGQEFLCH